MDVVLIFAIHIKNYLTNKKIMADKKDDKKKDEKKKDEKKPSHKKHSGGEMSFGLEVVLFVIAIFVIWLLMGKPQTENSEKPFIKGQSITVQ
jgi:cytoskeletal protein RodZ